MTNEVTPRDTVDLAIKVLSDPEVTMTARLLVAQLLSDGQNCGYCKGFGYIVMAPCTTSSGGEKRPCPTCSQNVAAVSFSTIPSPSSEYLRGVEDAARVMENLAFFTPVEELLGMTKQEMSVRTCHEGAKAIRALTKPMQSNAKTSAETLLDRYPKTMDRLSQSEQEDRS